jgi:serine/threonine protein kinase/tetratricopeptide (TPR) repeat protein
MMTKKPIFSPDPDQLNRLLSIGTGTEADTPEVCEDLTIAGLADKWLASSLGENASLRDPLLQRFSCLGPNEGSFADKSLFELLLSPKTDIAVLETISCYAKGLSLSVQTENESIIAITIYYAATARLLLSHDKKTSEYSYGSLMESFSDLIEKKWMARELRELFSEAQKTCQGKISIGDKAKKLATKQKSQQVGGHRLSILEEQGLSDLIPEIPGGRIGRYTLLRVLGEGGMGIVYLAEQEHPIKRHVAIKVIKPGMDSKRVIARFEAERQALALLDHPNIAHVYDAGTTENGRPYFVMEYVKGLSITEHCDHHKLMIENRLRLFLQICHAVQHAHQKGIIHRDIKPSNILISIEGDQVLPKVIDFGVAKALAQPLIERTFTTEKGQLFGTPEYMSPEQADVSTDDIDTRSDVYSLGILLYVLLTGVLPFDSKTFREGGIDHIRQVIRETNPKTPSSRLTSLGDKAEKVAENRQTEVVTLVRCLHKELEWIPLKAMRKERDERYRSASELADDIEHYLNGAPLIAGPPSTVYQLKKYVCRHRALITGIGAVLVVLVAGIVVATMLAIGQAHARAEAQVMSDFLRFNVLDSLDPFKVGGRQITIRTVLDTASKALPGKFRNMPIAEAEIRHTIGFNYWSLGLYKQAEFHNKRVLEIYRAYLGDEHPTTLERMKNLGWVYFHWSRYRKAEQLFTEALQGTRRVLGERDTATLDSMATLLMVYYMQGRFNEAEQLYLKALELAQNTSSQENLWAGGIAWGYTRQGRYAEAERLAIIALESYRNKQGNKDYITLQLTRNLGELYWKMGRYNKSEELLRGATNSWRDAWGDEHPETLWTTTSLGWLCYSQGKLEEAQSLFDKTLKIVRHVVGEEHFVTAQSMHGLGTVYLSQGKYDQAEPLLTDAWDILCRILSEENWATLSVRNTIGKLYKAQGRYKEAEETFRQVLETRKLKLGDNHPDTLETKNDLAMLYKEQARYEEAEKLLLEAVEGRRLKLGDTHPHTIKSIKSLIALYEAWNKPEKAQERRAKLQETEAEIE